MELIQIILEKLKESSNSEEFMKSLVDLKFKINPYIEIPMSLQPKLADRKVTTEEITNVFFHSSRNSTEVYIQILGKNSGKTTENFLVRE